MIINLNPKGPILSKRLRLHYNPGGLLFVLYSVLLFRMDNILGC